MSSAWAFFEGESGCAGEEVAAAEGPLSVRFESAACPHKLPERIAQRRRLDLIAQAGRLFITVFLNHSGQVEFSDELQSHIADPLDAWLVVQR